MACLRVKSQALAIRSKSEILILALVSRSRVTARSRACMHTLIHALLHASAGIMTTTSTRRWPGDSFRRQEPMPVQQSSSKPTDVKRSASGVVTSRLPQRSHLSASHLARMKVHCGCGQPGHFELRRVCEHEPQQPVADHCGCILTRMHLLCEEAWFGLASASGSEPAFSSVLAVTEPILLQVGGQ